VTPRLPRPRRRCHDDHGSVTAFIVVMTVTLVLCAGLVFDGGRMVAARVAAADQAENAARVAAQQTSDSRNGVDVALDPDAAWRAGGDYLAAHGVSGSVRVAGATVTVTVTSTTRMTMLSVIGVPARTITVARSAEAVTG
jgi:hypothetical protein